ncbi:hypothetical protein HZ326_0604 [Fusarium oxysporum f. sp. albedinis]|nr:hypothetical protein HZ326_0604 [Fusarium oxysporum f. sp. albedinis]
MSNLGAKRWCLDDATRCDYCLCSKHIVNASPTAWFAPVIPITEGLLPRCFGMRSSPSRSHRPLPRTRLNPSGLTTEKPMGRVPGVRFPARDCSEWKAERCSMKNLCVERLRVCDEFTILSFDPRILILSIGAYAYA